MDYWDHACHETRTVSVLVGVAAMCVIGIWTYILLIATCTVSKAGWGLHGLLWFGVCLFIDSMLYATALQVCDLVKKKPNPWGVWWLTLLCAGLITCGIWLYFHKEVALWI